MAAIADLIHEVSTSTGTGSLTLAAVNGKRRFGTVFGTGGTTNVFEYFISNRGAAEWERGTGHMSDANTLVRDTVIASSNSNAAVNFSAGTKDVMNDVPAADHERLSGGTWTGEHNAADQGLTRPYIKDAAEVVNALGSAGGARTIDLELGNVVTATVATSTVTWTFSNPPASGRAGSFTLILTNGGSQTVNWPASVKWADDEAPTLTVSGVDILEFLTVDGGTTWYGFAAGLNML